MKKAGRAAAAEEPSQSPAPSAALAAAVFCTQAQRRQRRAEGDTRLPHRRRARPRDEDPPKGSSAPTPSPPGGGGGGSFAALTSPRRRWRLLPPPSSAPWPARAPASSAPCPPATPPRPCAAAPAPCGPQKKNDTRRSAEVSTDMPETRRPSPDTPPDPPPCTRGARLSTLPLSTVSASSASGQSAPSGTSKPGSRALSASATARGAAARRCETMYRPEAEGLSAARTWARATSRTSEKVRAPVDAFPSSQSWVNIRARWFARVSCAKRRRRLEGGKRRAQKRRATSGSCSSARPHEPEGDPVVPGPEDGAHDEIGADRDEGEAVLLGEAPRRALRLGLGDWRASGGVGRGTGEWWRRAGGRVGDRGGCAHPSTPGRSRPWRLCSSPPR